MNEPTRMKRYRTWDYADEDQDEENTGTPMLLLADLQAWAGEVMALAEKFPHEPGCNGAFCSRCLTPVDRYEHWARDFDSSQHEFDPSSCSCNLGKLKAKLGEVCDGF